MTVFLYAAANRPLLNRRADVLDVTTASSVSVSVARPNAYAQAGQTVSLLCSATGTPTPVITWQKDGSDVVPGSRVSIGSDGTLEIRNFESGDEGSYACTATSGSNTDTQQSQVSLLGGCDIVKCCSLE